MKDKSFKPGFAPTAQFPQKGMSINMVNAFETFPNLLKPIKIGGVMFKNRMFGAPTGHTDIVNAQPSLDAVMYFERKAMGGAAAVCCGEVCADPDELTEGRWPRDITRQGNYNYPRLASAISRQGAVAVVELQFTGVNSRARGAKRTDPAWGPVDMTLPSGQKVAAMDDARIREVVEGFGKAALKAKEMGFGMVCLHGAHGWGLQQFMSPQMNTRTDKYGGNPENRCRFAVEAIDEIHRVCGADYPVEIRISGSEIEAGGYGVDEACRIAEQLDGHADIIHVSVGGMGHSAESFARTHVSMFYPQGRNVEYAAAIKKCVKKSLIGAVGGLSDPYYMEEILATGQADIVYMARGLICDPDLPNKLRQGKPEDVRKCMRCLSCFASCMNLGDFFCAINPEISRERETYYALPSPQKQRVLVIGGGIAGMQAALTASRNGHDVVLCEKSGELGGGILCEKDVPFKKRVHEYIEQQKRLICASNVELRMNTEVTPEYAKTERPDVVISAIGSEPIIPKIPGIDGANVVGAMKVYANPSLAKGKVVILGAGLVGTELAIYLHELYGTKAEIIEMGDIISDGGNNHQRRAVEDMLEQKQLPIRFRTKAVEITDKGVTCQGPNGEVFVEGDTIVYAVGMRPLQEEAAEFNQCAPDFQMIGECRKAANIMYATSGAHTAAKFIGRLTPV